MSQTLPPTPMTAAKRAPSSTSGAAASPLAVIDPMKLLQQYYPWLVAAGVVGIMVGVGAFMVLKRTYPVWESDVMYEISPVAQESTDPMGNDGNREGMEAYMNTMVKLASSNSILGKAIEEKAVRDTKWAEQFKDASGNIDAVEALKDLRDIVRARVVSDTNIMMLTVGTREKDDAPNIARSISDVFLDDTGSRSGRDMRQLIEQFEDVVKTLGKDIEQIDSRTEALLSKQALTALQQDKTVAYSEVNSLQPTLVRMRENLESTKQQLESYTEMLNNPSGPQFPEIIREEVERKPIVMSHDSTISAIKSSLRAMRESFGEKHREVQLLVTRLNAEQAERDSMVSKQMLETFATIVENLDNSKRNQEASLEEMQERLRAAAAELEDTTKALKQYEDWASERLQKVEKKSERERNVSEMRLLLARGSRIKVLQQAQIPDSLAFPKLIPCVALSVFLFGGLTAGIIALKELREQRIRGPQDVALIPRTRVLGLIPELSMDPSSPEKMELACRDRPRGVIADSVRQLRGVLCKEMHARGLRSVMIVGGLPGSGASSLISNLAFNAAATDLRVLVIDANLRRPALHTIFGVSEAPGLADVLTGNATLNDAVRSTSAPNVSILACGSRDTSVYERYTTLAMSAIFRDLKERFDLILVDSTPGVVAGDALAIASHCDAVVLVVRALSEKRGLVARLRNQLGETGAEFLGVVVNAVKPSAGGYFKRNYQVAHEYGREAVEPTDTKGIGRNDRNPPNPTDTNGTLVAADTNGKA